MKLFKRLVIVTLVAVMLAGVLLTGASAAEFPKIKTYTDGQFTDVPANAWYYKSVKQCYEQGLMSGISDTAFSPSGLFTHAQAASIAARLHHIYSGGDGIIPSNYASYAPAAAAGTWYSKAVGYCVANGIIAKDQFADYNANITRADMAAVIVAALPENAWTVINDVTVLPDVSNGTPNADAIFALYNAGIVSGSDEYGTYQPYAYITRAEVSSLIMRCANPSSRKELDLTPLNQMPPAPVNGTFDYQAKMECGLMPFKNSENQLYGYAGVRGTVIAPQFEWAGNFADGYALVEISGKYGIINTSGELVVPAEYNYYSQYDGSASYILGKGGSKRASFVSGVLTPLDGYVELSWYNENYISARLTAGYGLIAPDGQVIMPCEYTQFGIDDTGYFLVGERNNRTGYDIYSYESEKLLHFDGTVTFEDNCPLMAVEEGNKYALASVEGKITEAYYDSIYLKSGSSLAILKSGDMEALAGLNGIILDMGEYLYEDEELDGDYACVYFWDVSKKFAIADSTGIVSSFSYNAPSYCGMGIRGNYVVITAKSDIYLIYDTVSGRTYIDDMHLENDCLKIDSTCYLNDGTPCTELDPKWVYGMDTHYTFRGLDGKYGLALDGDIVVEPIYDTPEEAVGAHTWYDIETENGKPIVALCDLNGGVTPVIQYFQGKMYYDKIENMGDGYYACRFNTTWYILHV